MGRFFAFLDGSSRGASGLRPMAPSEHLSTPPRPSCLGAGEEAKVKAASVEFESLGQHSIRHIAPILKTHPFHLTFGVEMPFFRLE
jgi:hypothetical protein